MVCQNCGVPKAPMASFCLKCGLPFAPATDIPTRTPVYFQVIPITGLRRFWSLMLDVLLFWLTLGIGWFIWALILLPKAQTPAKQILDYVLVDHNSGKRPALWRVALRQFIPVALAVFTFFGPLYVITYTHEVAEDLTVPIGGTLVSALLLLIDALFTFSRQRRRLFDYVFNTSVVAGQDAPL
jgi:hypothetical protein